MYRVMVSGHSLSDEHRSFNEQHKLLEKQHADLKDIKVIPKHTWHLKNCSGVTPIPSGESTCDEWVSLAQDMTHHNFHLKPIEKFYILKKSLTGNTLTLMSLSDFNVIVRVQPAGIG